MAITVKDLGLIGKKIGMTQVFDAEGDVIPVTAIQIAENVITEIKNKKDHGYDSVQIGAFAGREKLVSKPIKASLQKKNLAPFRKLKEFRASEQVEGLNIGEAVDVVEFFKDLAKVSITGKSIGKGFQGGVKRYNMHVGRNSHGSKSKRQIGSLGAGTTPGRVFPGKRMPNMMGNAVVTITKAKVVSYDPDTRILLVRGPVPGKLGNTVSIKAFGVKSWNHNNK